MSLLLISKIQLKYTCQGLAQVLCQNNYITFTYFYERNKDKTRTCKKQKKSGHKTTFSAKGQKLRYQVQIYCMGGTIFWRGLMNFQKYLDNIFATLAFNDKKFYDPTLDLQY